MLRSLSQCLQFLLLSFGQHPMSYLVHSLPIFVLACVATACVLGLYWHNPFLIQVCHLKPLHCASIIPFGHFPVRPIRWHSQPLPSIPPPVAFTARYASTVPPGFRHSKSFLWPQALLPFNQVLLHFLKTRKRKAS